MPRAVDGTYETPSNSVAPAVASTTIDPDDFNSLVTDMETAISDGIYTIGMSATDNLLTRTDGTNGKKIQASTISVDDSGNMTGIGYVDIAEIAAPASPAANTARLYCVDSAGTTRLAYKDSAGAVTTISTAGGSTYANGDSINDTGGNELIKFGVVGSAVNEVSITNAVTTGKPIVSATGGDTNIILQFQGKGTGGVEIEGTSTNDSATAGYVGEVIESSVATGSSISLTTGTVANVTSISLTAGDWDISGQVGFTTAGSTSYSSLIAAISTTSATAPDASTIANPRYRVDQAAAAPGSTELSVPTGTGRMSLSSTTTVYLVARGTFTVSTLKAYGFIWARRAR